MPIEWKEVSQTRQVVLQVKQVEMRHCSIRDTEDNWVKTE